MTAMADLPRLLDLTHADSWSAPDPVRIDLTVRPAISASDPWLRGAPSVFDTGHDATGRFAMTNGGVTPTILGEVTDDQLATSIPMGYTDLSVNEKRAVVTDGRVVRLWAAAFEAQVDVNWFLLTADEDGGPVVMGAGVGIGPGHPLALASRVSRLMGGRAVVVGRSLERHFWH
jgi:hypothetical protein